MSQYRLEELAALSEVSVRNIRAYRERGLLDPPRRVGRSAFYDERHLAQLRTVNELLRKKFTSAHIAEFLDSTRQGHDLAEMLGLQQAVFGPPHQAVAVNVDPDGEEARRLVLYGLAAVVDGELSFVDPDIAEIVGRINDQLVCVQAILRVCDGVADLVDELAGAVVGALEQSLFARFGPNYAPLPDDMVELRPMVADYRALSARVVADRLEDVLQRHLVERLSGYTAEVALSAHGESQEH